MSRVVLLAALTLLWSFPHLGLSGTPTKRPHILFILSDDTGWNDVSFHGSRQIPTPTIDSLAAEGLQLNNYYVNPVCSPTRASLMTGRSVIHHGIQTPFSHGNDAAGLNLSYTLLPEQLKTQFNYTSYMIGKWHLGMKTPDYLPSSRGFSKFYGFYLGCSDYWSHYSNVDDGDQTGLDFHEGGEALGMKPGLEKPVYDTGGMYSTTLYSQKAAEWISDHARERPNSPMFMYLSYQATHSANNDFVQAPASYINRFNHISPENETCGQYDPPGSHSCNHRAMRKTIAATVSALDDGIKTVVDALKNTGMYEDTLIVYSSDNGGPPNGTNNNMMNNFPLRSGKGSAWEGGIRAAGFIHGKGLQRTGISNALFHVTDWYKTLLQAAAGNNAESDVHVITKVNEMPWKDGDGVANWDALSSADQHASSARTELVIAAQAEGSALKTHALRQGDFKIIWNANLMYGNNWWYLPPDKAWNYSDTLTVKCSKPPTDISDNICNEDFPHNPCLYNISADPCEHYNVAAKFPDIVHSMTKRMKELKKSTVLTWVNFQKADERAYPLNHGRTVAITPKPLKGGPQVYQGVWAPWLTREESAETYPENYRGPGSM